MKPEEFTEWWARYVKEHNLQNHPDLQIMHLMSRNAWVAACMKVEYEIDQLRHRR